MQTQLINYVEEIYPIIAKIVDQKIYYHYKINNFFPHSCTEFTDFFFQHLPV